MKAAPAGATGGALSVATPKASSGTWLRTPGTRRSAFQRWLPTLLLIPGSLLLWTVVGVTDIAGHGAIPTPWAILHTLWIDRSFYPGHISATLSEAAKGLVVGGGSALILGVLFDLSGVMAALFRGPVIVLVCVPVLIWAPLLAIAFTPDTAKVGVAAVAAFLPVLIGTIDGLRAADQDSVRMVRGFGGGRLALFTKVRGRSALPLVLAGLQVAVPGAILGATIGEYIGGDHGLGIFMLQSLRQYLPARTWGAGLIVTFLGAAGYVLVGLLGRRWMPPAGSLGTSDDALRVPAKRGKLFRFLRSFVLPVVVTLTLWQVLIKLLNLNSYFAKGPLEVFKFFTRPGVTDDGRSTVFHALAQTVPGAALGIVIGLLFGLGMAMLCVINRTVEATVLPVALILQSVPLQAFSPIMVLVLGRGLIVVLAISVIVSFFPTVVLASSGLRQVSEQTVHLFHGNNATAWQSLLKLRLPAALPSLIAAAKIAVPASVLGVLVAEFIATGDGIGHALAFGQAASSFDLVWAAATAMTVTTVIAYCLVSGAERLVNRRLR